MKDIIKECYWDYHISIEKLENIVNGDDIRQKEKLFDKIIKNSSDKLQALKIFKKDDLETLLKSYKDSNETILLLKNALLGERNFIKRLQWKK